MQYLPLDINQPPTQTAIDRAARNFRHMGYALMAVLLLLESFGMLLVMEEHIQVGFAYLLVAPAVAFISWLSLYAQFDSVGSEDYLALMATCQATPEGRAYRDAVLAEGRPFCQKELRLLSSWADKSKNNSENKVPYGAEGAN